MVKKIDYLKISNWTKQLTGKTLTPKNLVRRMYQHLNREHPVRIKFYQTDDDHLDPGDFCLGAEYDPDLDELGEKPFIVNFIINWPEKNPIELTDQFTEHLQLEIIEALTHEYQHQHQYRSRHFMGSKGYVSKHSEHGIAGEQSYLGISDEIDAYAANIAVRLFLLGQNLNTTKEQQNHDLQVYKKVFNLDHPIRKKLIKKVYKNLEQLKCQ